MLVFPSTPSFGAQFTAQGTTWQWDGQKWVARGRDSPASEVPVAAVGSWAPGNLQTALEELFAAAS